MLEHGFIPFSRARFIMDFVAAAMAIIVPALLWSIVQVKAARYSLHKSVQLTLGAVLLVAVVLFEIDVRLNGWRPAAAASPYMTMLVAGNWSVLELVLAVHLVFAVSATLLWTWVIIEALRRFASPPTPSAYSPRHKRLAWLATYDMCATTVTGWLFFWMAFIA